MLKKLVIVGKPNVGKSTLFNRLAKKKISITKHTPGVTRDRVYAKAKWRDIEFEIIDTGGLTFEEYGVEANIHSQAVVAIESADIILFVVDASYELTYEDAKVADLLRKSNKDVYVIANKKDRFLKNPELVFNLYTLGFKNIYPISAEHNIGVEELMKELYDKLKVEYISEDSLKVAIVGKPNAGKSSLVNNLVGESRSIVSEIAGTTRDTISSFIKHRDSLIELLDTAGIRKKARVDDDIEYYSVLRAISAIQNGDVVVLLIDVERGVTEQDQKIAGLAKDAMKPVIIAVNKIDIKPLTKEDETNIREKLKFLFAPIVKISAVSGKNTQKLLDKIIDVHTENHKQVTTSSLNEVLREILIHPPAAKNGKRVKINYVTQVSVAPPTFLFFSNYPDLIHFSYLRRLENGLRRAFGFEGVNIRIRIRKS